MTDEDFEDEDILDTYRITRSYRRKSGGGAWVLGEIAGYRFDALVFPEPALRREWEVNGDSRISKLCIRDERRQIVYNWDRGADIPAANRTVERIVELFADGLAESVFGSDSGREEN